MGATASSSSDGAPIQDSLGAGGAKAGKDLEQKAATPGEIAEQGFRGAPVALPHKAKMEQSFGKDLSFVKAYTDQHAKAATEKLGAHAYAVGHRVAFNSPNPDEKLVAHELTHVLQHTGQGGRSPTAPDQRGIDVGGEAEAEAVESKVASGGAASEVLGGGAPAAAAPGAAAAPTAAAGPSSSSGAATTAASPTADTASASSATSAAPTSASPGPARKAKGAPALSEASKFTMGMTFSPSHFEKSYEYTIWDQQLPPVPIPPVPGLFFIVEPSLKVKGGFGANWEDEAAMTVGLGLEGGVLIGLQYGNPAIASLYGGLECKVAGGFQYKKSSDNWSLEGSIALSSNFSIGCKLANGLLDYKFEFGKIDPIFRLGNIKWDNGNFSAGGFAWGPQILDFFAAINASITRAQELLNQAAEVRDAAINAARNTAQGAYNTGRDVVNWVTSW